MWYSINKNIVHYWFQWSVLFDIVLCNSCVRFLSRHSFPSGMLLTLYLVQARSSCQCLSIRLGSNASCNWEWYVVFWCDIIPIKYLHYWTWFPGSNILDALITPFYYLIAWGDVHSVKPKVDTPLFQKIFKKFIAECSVFSEPHLKNTTFKWSIILAESCQCKIVNHVGITVTQCQVVFALVMSNMHHTWCYVSLSSNLPFYQVCQC